MYRNLFVPVDGSANGERATQLPAYEQATERHIERTDTHARSVLTRFELKAAEAGVAFTGLHARTDGVDRAIIEQAETSGCDMIVMLTHGRGTLGELVFGSHTKNVLARSKLPLLVLH